MPERACGICYNSVSKPGNVPFLSRTGAPWHLRSRTTCAALPYNRPQSPVLILNDMELYPFNALNLKKRVDILWSHGSFVSVCRAQEPYVLYYMLDDFFVELEYEPDKVGILGLSAFHKGDRFERMVEAIRLDKMLDAA